MVVRRRLLTTIHPACGFMLYKLWSALLMCTLTVVQKQKKCFSSEISTSIRSALTPKVWGSCAPASIYLEISLVHVAMLQKLKASSLLCHSTTVAICAVPTATLICHVSPPVFFLRKKLSIKGSNNYTE